MPPRTAVSPRDPLAPRGLPTRPARLPADDLTDDATIRGVTYDGERFDGRSLEAADIEASEFWNARFTGARTRQVMIADTVFDTCDFAQLRAEDTALIRTRVTSSRLTGASWDSGGFTDVRFDTCRADLSLWRHSRFKAVAFAGCNLAQADFQWAELHDVTFTACDLTGAQFAHVKARRLRFQGCTMPDIGGAQHLKGATVAGPGGLELALALARDAGITIEP